MKKFNPAGFIVLAAVLLVLLYDLFIVMHDGNYDRSISQWTYRTSKDFLVIPVFAGIAIGHFFWPVHTGDT